MSRSYDAWRSLLSGVRLPAFVVDLEAVDHNLDLLVSRCARDLPLRVASKSVRVPEVLRYALRRLGDRAGGVMTFSAHETAWLAGQGFDDLLLAYPIARADEAVALTVAARSATVRVVVDAMEQAQRLSEAAQGAGVTLGVCLELDASWRPLGARTHLGVRRSPLRTADAVVALVKRLRQLPGLRVDGLMVYEAQIAGLRDRTPGGDRLDAVRRFIKRQSLPDVVARRSAAVAALKRSGCTVALVNGGGTGSVASTSTDPSVTEVTIGSGLFCPHLFDGYDGLPMQPAAFMALAVVRQPDAAHVTVAGGGYVASGSLGPDRHPLVHAPDGLEPLGMEGWGEVQTPFRVTGERPGLGDPVIARHAKAGEATERFASAHLVRGDAVVEVVPTYRGAGQCFF